MQEATGWSDGRGAMESGEGSREVVGVEGGSVGRRVWEVVRWVCRRRGRGRMEWVEVE